MTAVEAPDHVDLSTEGWHDDPFRQHRLRYFDGLTWTEHVTHFGPTPCRSCRRPT